MTGMDMSRSTMSISGWAARTSRASFPFDASQDSVKPSSSQALMLARDSLTKGSSSTIRTLCIHLCLLSHHGKNELDPGIRAGDAFHDQPEGSPKLRRIRWWTFASPTRCKPLEPAWVPLSRESADSAVSLLIPTPSSCASMMSRRPSVARRPGSGAARPGPPTLRCRT